MDIFILCSRKSLSFFLRFSLEQGDFLTPHIQISSISNIKKAALRLPENVYLSLWFIAQAKEPVQDEGCKRSGTNTPQIKVAELQGKVTGA